MTAAYYLDEDCHETTKAARTMPADKFCARCGKHVKASTYTKVTIVLHNGVPYAYADSNGADRIGPDCWRMIKATEPVSIGGET